MIKEGPVIKDGLDMARARGSSTRVAFLPIGAVLKLVEEAPGGGGFRAAVMKTRTEAYPNAEGFVDSSWVRLATEADLAAPPTPRFEVTFTGERAGRTLVRGARASVDADRVMIVLVRNPRRAEGYYILTAFPLKR